MRYVGGRSCMSRRLKPVFQAATGYVRPTAVHSAITSRRIDNCQASHRVHHVCTRTKTMRREGGRNTGLSLANHSCQCHRHKLGLDHHLLCYWSTDTSTACFLFICTAGQNWRENCRDMVRCEHVALLLISFDLLYSARAPFTKHLTTQLLLWKG